MLSSFIRFFVESSIDVDDTSATGPMVNPPEFHALFIKTMLLVGALLALTFFALWVLKRVGGGRFEASHKDSLISVIERKALTPKVSLWVVEIESEKFLIAESHNGLGIKRINQKEST